VLRPAAIRAVTATLLNIALWVAGDLAGASFLVDSGGGDSAQDGPSTK